MKTLGLLGGMSWESTVTYYREINEHVARSLGGLHSAKILMASVDFAEIEAQQAAGDWAASAALLGDAARRLAVAGADAIVICTNTMHKVANEVEKTAGIPLIHIADATADELLGVGIRRTALLGTKYTMLQDFYKSRLVERGLEVLIPEAEDVETVNRVIYEELCLGIIREESRRSYVNIIKKLQAAGAEAVILGCTEIGLLIGDNDSPIPVFDTTLLHAAKAAAFALSDESSNH